MLQKLVDGIVVISEVHQQSTTSNGRAFYNSESNRAFVQLEYVGYMKRDPDDAKRSSRPTVREGFNLADRSLIQRCRAKSVGLRVILNSQFATSSAL